MKREDFKIIPNYYSTNSLTYILYENKVLDFVETYKDLYYKQIDETHWESQKKKRPKAEVLAEAERKIKGYISLYDITFKKINEYMENGK